MIWELFFDPIVNDILSKELYYGKKHFKSKIKKSGRTRTVSPRIEALNSERKQGSYNFGSYTAIYDKTRNLIPGLDSRIMCNGVQLNLYSKLVQKITKLYDRTYAVTSEADLFYHPRGTPYGRDVARIIAIETLIRTTQTLFFDNISYAAAEEMLCTDNNFVISTQSLTDLLNEN